MIGALVRQVRPRGSFGGPRATEVGRADVFRRPESCLV